MSSATHTTTETPAQTTSAAHIADATAKPAAKKPAAKKPAVKPVVPAVTDTTKPFYAYVGAGDLAMTRLRQLPARYTELYTTQSGKLTNQVKELRGSLTAQVRELPAAAKEFPSTVRALPGQTAERVEKIQTHAIKQYDTLATRGHKLVVSLRKQASTQQAEKAFSSSVRQAKGAATSARKAAQATVSAAQGAASKIG